VVAIRTTRSTSPSPPWHQQAEPGRARERRSQQPRCQWRRSSGNRSGTTA
jgi:hypothetical protein